MTCPVVKLGQNTSAGWRTNLDSIRLHTLRMCTSVARLGTCRRNGRRYSEPSDESQVRKDPFDRASDDKNARRVYAPSASVRLPSSTIGDAPADSVLLLNNIPTVRCSGTDLSTYRNSVGSCGRSGRSISWQKDDRQLRPLHQRQCRNPA
jgi:hypothetical protein